MGVSIEIDENVILKRIHDDAKALGKEEGREEGRTEALAGALNSILTMKFGPLPKWAQKRVGGASTDQMNQWILKAATTGSLEGVLGRAR